MSVSFRPLRDCGRWLSGGTPSRKKPEYWGGDIPWISAKSMGPFDLCGAEERVTKLGAENGTRLIRPGTILFVVRGMSLAKEFRVGLVTKAATFNQDLKAIEPFDDVDSRYLTHCLRASGPRILLDVDSAAHGTRKLKTEFIEGFSVPLPPLAEQKRIAGILDAADALRAKRRESLAQLDTLLQSTFLDMFGDPVTNPMGWEVAKLGEVGEVQGGLQVTSKRKALEMERPYLRVANVFRGRLVLDEIKFIRLTLAEAERTALQKSDLLLVEGHGNRDEVGRCAMWDGSISGCVHQNHLIRVRCEERRLTPTFAEHYLNSPGGRRSLVGSARTTSGLNTISVSKVKAASVALPPLPLQERFVQIVGAVEGLRSKHRAHLAEFDTLFASLQSRAFRGEL